MLLRVLVAFFISVIRAFDFLVKKGAPLDCQKPGFT
jgi:hypothetical protein